MENLSAIVDCVSTLEGVLNYGEYGTIYFTTNALNELLLIKKHLALLLEHHCPTLRENEQTKDFIKKTTQEHLEYLEGLKRKEESIHQEDKNQKMNPTLKPELHAKYTRQALRNLEINKKRSNIGGLKGL